MKANYYLKRLRRYALVSTLLLPSISHAATSPSQIPFTVENQEIATTLDGDKNEITDETARYFTIQEVTVRELTESVWEKEDKPLAQTTKEVGDVVMLIDKIIAVGKKIWDIVSAGRPVVQTNMDLVISVLPQTAKEGSAFFDMEGWDVPESKDFLVEFKNGFNSTVVSFVYTVFYQGGGTFEGAGKYLTGVNITATNVNVSWGFDFNAKSALVAISNHGSKANPEAGATLQVQYTVKNWMKHITATETVHVMGRGEIRKLR